MKKYLTYIIMVFVSLLVVNSPVYAICPEETATIKLKSNSVMENLKIRSYGTLDGSGDNTVSNYGVTTFDVKFNNRNGSYFGYCLDPGFYYPTGRKTVCCSPVRSDKYSRGVRAGFIHLSKLAGSARKAVPRDENYIIATDMAIRLYAMATGLSNSSSTGSGKGFYQLTNYLQLVTNLLKQGEKIYGNDRQAINAFVTQSLRESMYSGFTLDSFITGPNSQVYTASAYAFFREALSIKETSDKVLYESKPAADISIDGTEEAISCNTNRIALVVKADSSVEILNVKVNDDPRVAVSYNSTGIVINKTSLFENSQCSSGAVTINIAITYRGGRDEDLYVCSAGSGKNVQKVLTYVGGEGGSSFDTTVKVFNYTLTMPSSCVPTEWMERCITGGYGRCLYNGTVEIKSSINNCCYDPNDGNTSVVTDSLKEKTIDDPLDIDDIFVKNPALKEHTLLSIVKCGLQSVTYAEDFRTTSPNADLATMRTFCQMYCMERTKIVTPPPVTVKAGRLFELDFNKFDIQGRRICRVSVDFAEFIKQYMAAVNDQVSAFNGYYKNIANFYYYKAGFDDELLADYRTENAIKEIKISCTKKVQKVWCTTDTWERSEYIEPDCSVPRDKCTINYDRINAASIPITSFPIPSSKLNSDVIKTVDGNTRYAYGLSNSYINATVRSSTGVKFNQPSLLGYFALSYDDSDCGGGDPFTGAGAPTCTCGGKPILESLHNCVMIDYTCGPDEEDPDGDGKCSKKVCRPVSNSTYNSVKNNFFSCSFDNADLLMYLYIKGAGYYPDYEADMNAYRSQASGNMSNYQAALSRIKMIEASMNDCINFFADNYYGAKDLENHYDVSKIRTSFEYDQIYSNESGQHSTMTTTGNIEPNCSVELVRKETEFNQDLGYLMGEFDKGFGDSKILRVSIIRSENLPYKVAPINFWSYQSGIVTGAINNIGSYYAGKILSPVPAPNGVNGLDTLLKTPVSGRTDLPTDKDGKVLFPKYVVVDGEYVVKCTFDDSGNTVYTLEPGGYVSSTPLTGNYTEHDKLLATMLTTYAGKHEILYHLSGLGSQVQREFDSYFQKGQTCSGRNSGAYNAPASCYFDVDQQLVTTGVCDGVASSSNYKTACHVVCAGDGTCDSIYNFMFKMVEPTNLFPTEIPDYDDPNGWGKNWLTATGRRVRSEVESDGENDLTYAPGNLTYSFVLSPQTINAIKKYNSHRYEAGGYSDFSLSCDCGSNGNKACIRCSSSFLSNLAQNNGIMTINDTYVAKEKIWASDQDIQLVRTNNPNWNRDNTRMEPVLH